MKLDTGEREAAKVFVKRLWRMLAGPPATGVTVTRFAMYQELDTVVPASLESVLSVSRSEPLVAALGLRAPVVTAVDFPEFDLRDLAFPDASFDLLVSDQVLEHVEGDPFAAVRESLRVVRPGGYVVHTTCFMNPVHEHPHDYWRFTPAALRLLCESAGADVVASGGWGNRLATTAMELGWRDVPVPRWRWHPWRLIADYNDSRWPVSTWVVARQPPRER